MGEKKPLLGKRVLVTRPRAQAADLMDRLIELGAVPFLLPTVEIREPTDWRPVDEALDHLHTYNWLVFTSVNGVHGLMGRLRTRGGDARALTSTRLAAIGPKTAGALRQYELQPDLVPHKYRSEDLAAALKDEVKPGQRVLLARADRGRDVLRDELPRIAHVEQIAVYSQVDAVESGAEVLEAFRRGEIDYVLLTSSNIARSLIDRLDESCRQQVITGRTRFVSISALTSAEVGRLGLPVAAEAAAATEEDLLEALCRLEG
jgi:uroporphyrinogen III methyltransferase/synthase